MNIEDLVEINQVVSINEKENIFSSIMGNCVYYVRLCNT